MTSRTLTDEQIKALDFQVDQLYSTFKRALETQSYQDAVWSQESFAAFGKSLVEVTNHSGIMRWKRDTKRAGVFDKYILTYALGYVPSGNLRGLTHGRKKGLETHSKEIGAAANASKFALGNPKLVIDNPKIPYGKIESMAGYTHDFSVIISALEYVREKYKV